MRKHGMFSMESTRGLQKGGAGEKIRAGPPIEGSLVAIPRGMRNE